MNEHIYQYGLDTLTRLHTLRQVYRRIGTVANCCAIIAAALVAQVFVMGDFWMSVVWAVGLILIFVLLHLLRSTMEIAFGRDFLTAPLKSLRPMSAEELERWLDDDIM